MFEVIGIIASVLVVISSLAKTTTFKGTMWFRIMNLLGSIFFVAYGIIVKAYSTSICNLLLFFISIFYIIKEIKDHSCINNCDKNNQSFKNR